MRRITVLLLGVGLAALMAGCGATPRAQTSEAEGFSLAGTGRECGRGVVNVTLCWLEIPYEVEAGIRKKPISGPFDAVGATLRGALGVVSGAVSGVERIIGGTLEVLLSPFPPYGPLMDPPYPPYLNPTQEPVEEG